MTSTPTNKGRQGRTILIADPDHESVRWLGPLLRDRGYQIHAASDGSQALQMTLMRHPDLILFDVACSLIEVEAFLRILRSNPRTEPIPVVVTSGNGQPPHLVAAQGSLRKPYDEDELFGRIEQALRGSKLTAPAKESDLHGQLSQLPIPDLLQVLAMNQRTGRLLIRGGRFVGEVSVVDGKIHDARTGAVRGEKALFRIFSKREGSFEFQADSNRNPDTIGRSLDRLLLDGSYQADELKRLEEKLPGAREPIALSVIPASLAKPPQLLSELLELLAAGPLTVEELFDRSQATDLEVASGLVDLLARGWVWAVPREEAPAEPPLLRAEEVHTLHQRLLRSKASSGRLAVGKIILAAGKEDALRGAVGALSSLPGFQREGEQRELGTFAAIQLGEDVRLELVGLPTAEELRPLWPLWSTGAIGALIVGDASGGGQLGRWLELARRFPVFEAASEDNLSQAVRDLLLTVVRSPPDTLQ